MITLINATNRHDNQSQIVSLCYKEMIEHKGVHVKYFSLEKLPLEYLNLDRLKTEAQKNALAQIIGEYIIEVEKIIIVAPEYQGSFPGIFKLFLDFVKPEYWRDKKVALVGVSKGRAGNLRGLDHLTNIFHYLQANVMPQKLPISSLQNLIKDGKVNDDDTLRAVQNQIELFLKY